MTDAPPEIYTRWGEPLLGPWEEVDPEIRQAWVHLAEDVEAGR